VILRTLLAVAGLLLVAVAALFLLGQGWGGDQWASAAPVAGPRPDAVQAAREQTQAGALERLAGAAAERQILFGDLHVHTSFSSDAALFGLNLDNPAVTPSDACDFARYCSALDFWSINDHAEGMTPRSWNDTVSAIRDCNAQSGDPGNPDLVSLVGWEWSQGRGADTHYGHKNVIFREWEEGRTPLRPIASAEVYSIIEYLSAPLRGALSLQGDFRYGQSMAGYFGESRSVTACDQDTPSDQLPADCREVALNPTVLYRKLDELGFDALVIPHGLSWGRTNPRDADFAGQIAEHDPRYQRLVESYSGHGNSEVFADFERRVARADGGFDCPLPREDFVPCCHRAGELIRARCDEPGSTACEDRVARARAYAAEVIDDRLLGVVPDASLEDWGQCGQLLDSFLPAWNYVPRQSTQYNLALGDFSRPGPPRRARFGIMASSDNHQARAGTGYKEFARTVMTDTKDYGQRTGDGRDAADLEPVQVSGNNALAAILSPNRMASFYYTGGLIAVHAESRGRDDLWSAMENRQVYGTSGERMLLWFDLLDEDGSLLPMGSETSRQRDPTFRVRALGAFRQLPGCPDYSVRALGERRVAELCRGECYHPTDQRKAITRIEVVRIRPQLSPAEPVGSLIEDPWRSFDCPGDGQGCEVTFSDGDFAAAGRETLYYVRAIQELQPTINGDNYRCEYDDQGRCVKINFCRGDAATPEKNCLSDAEPRAWSSPIFVDYNRG
jgi:hypothetical protein